MAKVTGLVTNSGEDFVDELSSSIVYKYSKGVFGPTLKKLNESDDLVDNALGGAIQTLQFGMMNMVIISVTEYAMTKTAFVSGAIFVFLKTTNIAKRVKGIMVGALGAIPFVGRGLAKVADSVGSFVTKDREVISNMAMSTSNNMSTVISQERQTQVMIKQSKYRKIDSTLDNAISIRGQGRQKQFGYFTHKTKTGTWSKTTYNKKLYEDCTGQKFGQNGLVWNLDFIDKLNGFSEFAKTAEGKIFSQAKATVDLINAQGGKIV